MRSALSIKDAVLNHALLSGSVPLETFLVNRGILSMVIRVHLHVACTDVCFITFILNAVIVRLLAVVLTVAELNCAIV